MFIVRKKAILVVMIALAIVLLGYFLFQFVYYGLADMPAKYTDSWKTIDIEGSWSFKIPEEWQVEKQNGILHITNNSVNEQGNVLYLIGATLTSQSRELHELLGEVEKGDDISGVVYSNGAHMSLVEYYTDNKKEEHYVLSVTMPNARFELIVWSMGDADEELIRQIAKTFIETDR